MELKLKTVIKYHIAYTFKYIQLYFFVFFNKKNKYENKYLFLPLFSKIRIIPNKNTKKICVYLDMYQDEIREREKVLIKVNTNIYNKVNTTIYKI